MEERRERLVLRNKVELEKHSEIHGGLKEGIGMKTYLHDPMDSAKTPKLRFRVGDLDPPEKRKRQTSGREGEEEIDAQICPCVWQSYSEQNSHEENVKYTRRNGMCFKNK